MWEKTRPIEGMETFYNASLPKGDRVKPVFPVARFISEYLALPVRRWLPDGATKCRSYGAFAFFALWVQLKNNRTFDVMIGWIYGFEKKDLTMATDSRMFPKLRCIFVLQLIIMFYYKKSML